MKTALGAVLLLASLGILGVAFAETSALRGAHPDLKVATVSIPAFPTGGTFGAAAAAADPKPAETKPADSKPAEVPAPEVKAPEPKPETKPAATPVAPEEKPVAAKPAVAKPADPVAAKPPPAPPSGKPATKPAEPTEAPVAAAASTDAILNLSSDTADVYVDGKKVGSSPVKGVKLKAGKHKVRFDCYDASGAPTKGPEKAIDLRALEEKDIDYECPTEAAAPKAPPKEDDLP